MKLALRAFSATTLTWAALAAVGVVWWGRGDLDTGEEEA